MCEKEIQIFLPEVVKIRFIFLLLLLLQPAVFNLPFKNLHNMYVCIFEN